jgi:hypothetical protein
MTLPLEKLTDKVNLGGTSTVWTRASEEEGGSCVGIRLGARRAAPAKDHEQRRTTEGGMGLRWKQHAKWVRGWLTELADAGLRS